MNLFMEYFLQQSGSERRLMYAGDKNRDVKVRAPR